MEAKSGISRTQLEKRHLRRYPPSTHQPYPPPPPVVVKDWHYFNVVSPEQSNLWNKKELMTPMSLYLNERPHLDIWAKEKEEERRLKDLEAEREREEIRKAKILQIKEQEFQQRQTRRAVCLIFFSSILLIL